MSQEPKHDERLWRLLDAACAGMLEDEQVLELEQILRANPAAQMLFADYCRMHAAIRFQMSSQGAVDRALQQIERSSKASGGQGEKAAEAALFDRLPVGGGAPLCADSAVLPPARRIPRSGERPAGWRSLARDRTVRAIAAGMLVGTVISGAVVYPLARNGKPPTRPDGGAATLDARIPAAYGAPYQTTLVNLTNCRWDPEGTTANVQGGGSLGAGQSLSLLEGVAEISSVLPNGGLADFQIEGPSAMLLTSEGLPSLQYGRLAAQITCDFGPFSLNTPLGRVIVHRDASVGIVSVNRDIELHAFEGQASFEPMWGMGDDYPSAPLSVVAGESMRITISPEAGLTVERGTADKKQFVSLTSMAVSQLDVSGDYVTAVRDAKPIAYWRFERDAAGVVPNEMGGKLHCRVHGEGIQWHSYFGNRSVEFGSSPNVGCLMSDDTLENLIDDDYSVEAWIKPSHYHRGAVFSLISWPPSARSFVRHGALIELCGPLADQPKTRQVQRQKSGRLRFLHRSGNQNTDTACFSEDAYTLRQWQHVVVTKTASRMRLYTNGQLANEAEDSTRLPDDLRILIGQLYPPASNRLVAVRPFIGELDEIAIYDRALGAEEIERHFHLVSRP